MTNRDPASSHVGPAESSPSAGADHVSLLEVATVLLRHWKVILLSTFLAIAVAVILALQTPTAFTSSATFVPQNAQSEASGLSSLAGRFGFTLPGGSGSESPEFYAELIRSRAILDQLVSSEYAIETEEGERRGSLSEIMEVETDDPAESEAALIESLRSALDVEVRRTTGIIDVSFTSPFPDLSKQIVERILELVNQFNLEMRQSKRVEERTFIEGRLAEAGDSLRAAERLLQEFLANNRQFLSGQQGSPGLMLEYERLQRRVGLRQQVYSSLASSYEEARIAEVRATPATTLIEHPRLAVRPDPRGRLAKLVFGAAAGLFIGVFLAFGQEYASRVRREDSEEFRRLAGVWDSVREELRRVAGRRNR